MWGHKPVSDVTRGTSKQPLYSMNEAKRDVLTGDVFRPEVKSLRASTAKAGVRQKEHGSYKSRWARKQHANKRLNCFLPQFPHHHHTTSHWHGVSFKIPWPVVFQIPLVSKAAYVSTVPTPFMRLFHTLAIQIDLSHSAFRPGSLLTSSMIFFFLCID